MFREPFASVGHYDGAPLKTTNPRRRPRLPFSANRLFFSAKRPRQASARSRQASSGPLSVLKSG
jgi:hypothetical protein